MNFKKFLIASAPALLLASCASDEPMGNPDEGVVGTGTPMYAKIRVHVPTGTRSQTTVTPGENTNSEAGYEVGQPYENDIERVTIVLATLEGGVYKPVASSSDFNSIATMPDPVNPGEYTIMFKDEEIVKLANQKVYIFAYCNSDLESSDFTNVADLATMEYSISSAAAGQGIWKSGEFLMVNAPNKAIPTQTLPEEKALINSYNSPEKALDLGDVDVARAAARFDFKVTNGNKYVITDVNKPENVLANVELVEMAPLNVAKTFYTLPRVSADGTSNGWTLCGNEVRTNYVVSPFFTEKMASSVASLSDKFFYPTADMMPYESYSYNSINEWYGAATNDDDENWDILDEEGNRVDRTGYKIWRYVTENTIPGVDEQRTGISTGVVFKGKITDAKGLMGEAMAAGQAVYAYNGIYYGGIANLRRVVANLNEGAKMREDFVSVFGEEYLAYTTEEVDGKIVRVYNVSDADLKDCTSAANNGTFKILRPAADGEYYVYYVYRNRHNDNGQSTVMGPMEFATVRNNVYKLSVSLISDFGHTNDPKDDPDPDDPDNPDETPKTYFKVSCRVLPWIVRVNNIEF